MDSDTGDRGWSQSFFDTTDFMLSYAVPKASLMPSIDSSTPIPAGKHHVEKFLVSIETEGGD